MECLFRAHLNFPLAYVALREFKVAKTAPSLTKTPILPTDMWMQYLPNVVYRIYILELYRILNGKTAHRRTYLLEFRHKLGLRMKDALSRRLC